MVITWFYPKEPKKTHPSIYVQRWEDTWDTETEGRYIIAYLTILYRYCKDQLLTCITHCHTYLFQVLLSRYLTNGHMTNANSHPQCDSPQLQPLFVTSRICANAPICWYMITTYRKLSITFSLYWFLGYFMIMKSSGVSLSYLQKKHSVCLLHRFLHRFVKI